MILKVRYNVVLMLPNRSMVQFAHYNNMRVLYGESITIVFQLGILLNNFQHFLRSNKNINNDVASNPNP
jgi:hypothetical protein